MTDPVDTASAAQRIVLDGLERIGGPQRRSDTDVFIVCPFHDDTDPSCGVCVVHGAGIPLGYGYCLAGDTGVMTNQGTVPIRELSGKTAEVLSPEGTWVEAPFKCYGRQRLYKLSLTRNRVEKTIYATKEHRWFIRSRQHALTTLELEPGDRLETTVPKRRTRWDMDIDGIQHGIVFGDGTLVKRHEYGSVDLHGQHNETLMRFFPGYEAKRRYTHFGKPYLNVYGGKKWSHMKTLPTVDKSDKYLLGFLAGYLAADGHISYVGTIMLHSSKRENLERVRDIATHLGIVTYGITSQRRVGLGTKPTDIYRIHFDGLSMHQDMMLFKHSRIRFRFASKTFSRLRWTVKDVQETDRIEPVFCAEVPVHHAFALEDNILTGNCFGCSWKGGWNLIAAKLDLPKIAQGDGILERAVAHGESISRRRIAVGMADPDVHMPDGVPYPYSDWRGISGGTVHRAEGIMAMGRGRSRDEVKLYFPVCRDMDGRYAETVGVVQADMEKTGRRGSGYILLGGSRVKDEGLFPLAAATEELGTGRYSALVLVEGPRDALRLIQDGVPALSILSTTQWSEKKAATVAWLCRRSGVRPVVMMDGDGAGDKARRRLVADLGGIPGTDPAYIDMVRLAGRLGKDDLDPANAPDSLVRSIRRRVAA